MTLALAGTPPPYAPPHSCWSELNLVPLPGRHDVQEKPPEEAPPRRASRLATPDRFVLGYLNFRVEQRLGQRADPHKSKAPTPGLEKEIAVVTAVESAVAEVVVPATEAKLDGGHRMRENGHQEDVAAS